MERLYPFNNHYMDHPISQHDSDWDEDDDVEYEDDDMIDTVTDDGDYQTSEKLTLDKVKSQYECFTCEGNDFYPCKRTTVEIPSGYYKIRKDYSRGIFFRKQNVNLSKLVVLESCPLHKKLLGAIRHFWESKEEYRKRGKVYKLNILLYSPPGMGKTSLINLVIDDLIKNRNGIVINLSEDSDIMNFNDAMMYLRAVMPERPIIVVVEDMDNFVGDNSRNKTLETELLNILDGNQKHDNLIIIGTTNYPETFQSRYINRPSRFNLLLEYEYPNEDFRREFFIKTNLKSDLDKIDLEKWVKATEGYTTDYLNELSMSVFINNQNDDEAIATLDKMRKEKVLKCKDKNKTLIGF